MARRPPRPKPGPDAPDLPAHLEPAPTQLSTGSSWEAVAAGPEVDVPPIVADAELSEVRWAGAVLSGRRFTSLRATDVEFLGCDLSGTALHGAHLRRVSFVDCRLSGAILGTRLEDVRISGGRADLASFAGVQARYLLIEDTLLRGADFSDITAEDCALLGCELDEATFHDARLRRTRLHGSTLDGVRGARSLAGVEIGADQVLPLGTAVLAEMGVTVT